MTDLVSQLRALASALIALRTGVTLEASKKLPPCDPVTVADALEEAADHIEKLEALLWAAMDDASISPGDWYAEARQALQANQSASEQAP